MPRLHWLAAALAALATAPSAPIAAAAQSSSAVAPRGRLVDAVLPVAYRAELAGRYRAGMDLLRAALTEVEREPEGAHQAARLLGALGLLQSEAAAYDGFPRDSALTTLERARRRSEAAGEARGLADALGGIGRVRYWAAFDDSTPSWDVPRQYLQAADSIHRLLRDSLGIAQGYFRLGLIHERMSQTDSAMALYRAGEALARRRGYDLELSYVSRHIGYYFDEVRHQLDSALVYHRRSLDLRERAGFRPGEVFALVAIGDLLRSHGRLDEAVTTYREAIRRGEMVGVRRALTAAWQGLGNTFAALGRDADGEEAYRRALDLAERIGLVGEVKQLRRQLAELATRARARKRTGLVETTLVEAQHAELAGQYRAAAALLRATLSVVEGQPARQRDAARVLSALGRVQQQAASYDGASRDTALATLERARRLAESVEEASALAEALGATGWVHYRRGFEDSTLGWELPRRYFAQADTIYRRIGDSLGIAQSYFRLGLIHERRGEPDLALPLYRSGEALASRRGYDLELSYLSRHIGGYFEEVTKQLDSALVYQRRSLELRERTNFRPGQVFALLAIGDVLRAASRPEEASASYREALRRAEQIGVMQPLTAAREAVGR